MLTILAGILGSSGFGSLIGWLGGAANRWIDLKNRDKDIAVLQLQQAHELAKLDKDREFMLAEYQQRTQIATIEGEAKVEAAGYDALTASYGADKATYGIKWVDGIRGVVRPILTLLFFLLSCVVFAIVAQYVWARGVPLSNDQLYELFKYCIYWVLFQASVCVGWWFAMRPGNKPPHK